MNNLITVMYQINIELLDHLYIKKKKKRIMIYYDFEGDDDVIEKGRCGNKLILIE